MRLARIAALVAACMPGAGALALTPLQALEVVRQRGSLEGPAEVDGNLDLSLLRPPRAASARPIVFKSVSFKGTLSGVPGYPLQFDGGTVCGVDGRRSEWPKAVEFRDTVIARIDFGGGRLASDFTCLNCRICQTEFREARFGGEATFSRSHFGEVAPRTACTTNAPPRCAAANFSDAFFAGIARFDRAVFRGEASFDGAEFRGNARFAAARAEGELSFIGARMRGMAEFRDCTLAALSFAPAPESAARSYELTEFSSQADFRGCQFKGPARFDDVLFLGDAIFSRATFGGDSVSFRGAFGSRTIHLREAIFRPQAKLILDATSADSVRLGWDEVGPAVMRGAAELKEPGQRIAMLEALSRRLETQGAARPARSVAFEAQREQRADRGTWCANSPGECLAGEAEWWLWKRPTRNGTDPTVVLAALVALWVLVAAIGCMPGRIVVLKRLGRERTPAYALALAKDIAGHADYPVGPERVRQALTLATRLVFKLGSPKSRFVAPGMAGAAAAALGAAWVLSWVLIAALAAVVAASFPGLSFLKAAL